MKTTNKKHTFLVTFGLIVLAVIIVFFSRFTNTSKERESARFDADYSDEGFYDEIASTGLAVESQRLEKTARAETLMESDLPLPSQSPTISEPTPQTDDRHVIKTGSLGFIVENIESAVNAIQQAAEVSGGSVLQKNIYGSDSKRRSGVLTVQVPVDRFEEAIQTFKKSASVVQSETSTASDVTEQYIDIEARLANQKNHEDRLRTFFDRAEDVKDLVTIEKELARVRGKIEQLESQLKNLTNKTTYSTITISLQEELTVGQAEGWRPLVTIKTALHDLTTRFQNIADASLYFVISEMPVIILAIISLAIAYALGSRAYRYIAHKMRK